MRERALLAGCGIHPYGRWSRLPGLRGKERPGRRKRSCIPLSGIGEAVGLGKNWPLRPEQVLPGSHRAVWWICESGHEWRTQIKLRTSGCDCPVCANRVVITEKNDLRTRFADIAAEWHPSKNGALTPQQVSAGAQRKVWWQCSKGHVWQAAVYSRTGTRKCGCPICAGRGNRARQQRYQALLMQERNPQR